MPELPEVETVRRALVATLVGSRIARVTVREPRLRWPVLPATLATALGDATFVGFRRRGKYVLADLRQTSSVPVVLAVHLGMTGWWGVRTGELWPHDHIVLELDDGRLLVFNDARRFGSWHVFAPSEEASHRLLAHLGREPLARASFSGAYLHAACRRRTTSIKERLMDATCVVGVGNIYASEALFLAGIHPKLPAGRLSLARAELLAEAVRTTLKAAIAKGGTTFRDFRGSDGAPGRYTARLQVYGREGAACPSCATPIKKFVQGGRATYFCPRCQAR